MEILIGNPLGGKVCYYLAGLIAAALFFAMTGIKELKIKRFEGIIYLALSVFFIFAHVLFFISSGAEYQILSYISHLSITGWMVALFAPALIFLYLLFGLFNCVSLRISEGIIKIFIGVAMMTILYSLGVGWPDLIKIPLILISLIVWFGIELSAVEETS
ncbi:MAG: hypothetical protein DRP46_10085 [Candidatus Zixiibacteriota bacterium]|nr:MAG: hypothetical protein DRP46_10085 [candidate division Zixibacteria bacterium]